VLKAGVFLMERAKNRPKAATFGRRRPGLAPRTFPTNIITVPGKNASPNPDRRGGFPLMTGWELFLAGIGTLWLVSRMFRVIDWIERR